MNTIKTTLLLAVLTVLLVLAGGAIGGQQGMILALFLAAAMNFFSYWYSDKIILRMYRAQPVTESQAPELFAMVRELTQKAGLPMPKICVMEQNTPNAFATGRDPDHAVVAVTTGIVNLLSPRELRGVISHELAHVKHRDILVGSVAATLAGAIMFLASMARWSMIFGGGSGDDDEGGGALGMVGVLMMSILAPLAAMLVQMAVSRSREYGADQGGADMSGDPEALASALAKLEQANQRRPMPQARPQTAHMFTVSPLSGSGLAGLFSTHPPIAERVARLRQMTGSGQVPPPPPRANISRPDPPPPPRGGRGSIDWS
ncbi:MAG: zinc metalloprotease HtpX [Desulfarculaceae bacterium]|jgi:heat shock protein HtpX